MNNMWILAQIDGNEGISSMDVPEEGQSITTAPGDANETTTPGQQTQTGFPSYFILLALMLVMVFVLFRTPQKQKQQRKKLEKSLKKNDKVLTIGGIMGTIVDIKDNEITLKIDESNNTKIKVLPSAIGRNLSKDNV